MLTVYKNMSLTVNKPGRTMAEKRYDENPFLESKRSAGSVAVVNKALGEWELGVSQDIDIIPDDREDKEGLGKEAKTSDPMSDDTVTEAANTDNHEPSSAQSDVEFELSKEERQEMTTLIKSFPGLSSHYRLCRKIGEGTFSTVYKAIDLRGSKGGMTSSWNSPPIKRIREPEIEVNKKKKIPYVALKRIYVTASPQRIFNELNLLYSLSGSPNVAPLLDALRYEDQVIAVLPYCRHTDFRLYYRDMPLSGIKIYMHELLTALDFIHSRKIIHRDIKSTNFLYDVRTRRGVLVDFGLAEREKPIEEKNCSCSTGGVKLAEVTPLGVTKGYLKDDKRSARRANRAGTRGFRAPEVLLRCGNQTTKIDIWAAGVMLLTLMARRFPFFDSPDDTSSLIELTSIFGHSKMKKIAQLHGLGLESNIPRLESHKLGEIIHMSLQIDAEAGDMFADDSPAWETFSALDSTGQPLDTELGRQYGEMLQLLEGCMKLDHYERISAREALKLPAFKELNIDDDGIILN
ncbi:unnamed protein product [Kuraishia capsulata CBS 1993]|uniref:non-specific serine/threonine protein kinase n=1 Tax=Kuraishia capsulata CBS 1993 TaxID=1382522 RepID=W6ML95_9ASCO|nr:uncharacterized protein KUCA_T00003242001 [Kuraishia capsulata CBS 1993]CDK27264.1 unnamed protein product [Kuraishia capsulata CBS 1993]